MTQNILNKRYEERSFYLHKKAELIAKVLKPKF